MFPLFLDFSCTVVVTDEVLDAIDESGAENTCDEDWSSEMDDVLADWLTDVWVANNDMYVLTMAPVVDGFDAVLSSLDDMVESKTKLLDRLPDNMLEK